MQCGLQKLQRIGLGKIPEGTLDVMRGWECRRDSFNNHHCQKIYCTCTFTTTCKSCVCVNVPSALMLAIDPSVLKY